ncbi:unnamed protein product [Paramecium pentaurelia]|uniref:Uncharacterized protein n=1 Tax=Paramecium pentaurelia TaxID=43138 RepID=A0A8S1T003_9CILI|nr:unnamed protein product [Paramecium pentaurelia]
MDNQLGIGAFKFQSLVSKEMRSSKDFINNRSQIRIEHRLSLIEKSKQQLKPPRKTKNNQASRSSNRQNAQILGEKQAQQFEFNISSSSSSTNSEGIGEKEEQTRALHSIKKLGMNIYTPQPSPQKQVPTQRSQTRTQKKEIQFLRSLCQNSELTNNSLVKLDEYKIDKEIYVDIDCKDITTFLRLQHEVEEMRRKQTDFHLQKQRHFEVLGRKDPKKANNLQHEDFWTILMAKRTAKKLIKNMNWKRKNPEEEKKVVSKSIHAL